MTRITLTAAALLLSTTTAFAVGSDDSAPPQPTQTSETCEEGQIWDAAQGACVEAKESHLNDDQRYEAVRELAYAGQYDRAQAVIAAADAPGDARFLNYRGFIARKTGDIDGALKHYRAALELKPDYILARSYMAQALIQMGEIEAAQAELLKIREVGGRETWAYVSLKQALSGKTSNY